MWTTILIIVLAILWVVFWGAATAHYIDGPLERPYHFTPKVALGFVLGALLGPFGPLVTINFLMDKSAYSPFATWGTFYGESLSAGMAALNPLNHFSEWERARRAGGYREREYHHDTITCPHCNSSIREPKRRKSGADIEIYEFPCSRCGKMIYVKARGY